MDRLTYILTLIKTLTDLDVEYSLDFSEQVEALKGEAGKEIARLINSKEYKTSYSTQTDNEIPV